MGLVPGPGNGLKQNIGPANPNTSFAQSVASFSPSTGLLNNEN